MVVFNTTRLMVTALEVIFFFPYFYCFPLFTAQIMCDSALNILHGDDDLCYIFLDGTMERK